MQWLFPLHFWTPSVTVVSMCLVDLNCLLWKSQRFSLASTLFSFSTACSNTHSRSAAKNNASTNTWRKQSYVPGGHMVLLPFPSHPVLLLAVFFFSWLLQFTNSITKPIFHCTNTQKRWSMIQSCPGSQSVMKTHFYAKVLYFWGG